MANQEDFIRFNIRIPPELNEALDRSAKENKHSKNAEIIQRLENSYHQIPDESMRLKPDDVFRMVEAAINRVIDTVTEKAVTKAIDEVRREFEGQRKPKT